MCPPALRGEIRGKGSFLGIALTLVKSVSECLESKILHSYLDSLRRFSFLVKRKRSGGRGNAPDWRKWLVHPACSGTLQRPGFLLY